MHPASTEMLVPPGPALSGEKEIPGEFSQGTSYLWPWDAVAEEDVQNQRTRRALCLTPGHAPVGGKGNPIPAS